MRNKNTYTLASAVAVLLLTAACGTSGLGDILGGGGGTDPQTQTTTLHGTVDQIDTNSSSILLRDVRDYAANLSGGTGSSVRVYYDAQTVVDYQGRNYRPQDLERGDQVDVRYTRSGSNLLAQSMTVTYDTSTGTGTTTSSPGSYGSVRGAVQSVDTSRRRIQVNTGGYSNSVTTLDYDANTTVAFEGRTYRPEDLERGDQIDVTTRNVSGAILAQHISVLSSATSGGTSSSAQGTVQGTVSSVDTSRRTIQLTQAVWGPGFTTGNTQTSVTVLYDDRSYVDFQGQSHPPTGLERGDVVNIELRSTTSSSTPLAGRITLLRNVRGS